MTAPTEQEIREHVEGAWRDSAHAGRRGVLAFEDAWSDVAEVVDSLWEMYDLRPSEEARLSELLGAAIAPLRDDARPRLQTALIEVAAQFATEYPDAPRAREKVPA